MMENMPNNLTGAISALVAEIENMMVEKETRLREEIELLKNEVVRLNDALLANEGKDAALRGEIEMLREAMMVAPVAVAVEEAASDAPVIEFEPMVEPVVEEAEEPKVEAQEEVFAPEELDSASTPAPEPEMEQIEGNKYEALFEEDPAREEVVEEVEEEESAQEVVVEEPVVEEPEPAPMPEPIEEVEKEEETEQKATPSQKVEQPSLFDYLGGTPATETLAEKIAYKRVNIEEQLESHVNKKKVDDLRQVININDKFSFMNELFNNNMRAYNEFIMKLNAIQDRDEAMQVTEQVAQEYGWDMGSLAVRTFYKYFDRKF